MINRLLFGRRLTKLLFSLGCLLLSPLVQADPGESISSDQQSLAQIRLLEQSRRKEMSAWRPFLKSNNRQTKIAAMRSVGQARVQKALPILRKAASDGSDQELQNVALFSLALLGELEAQHLVRVVSMAPDPKAKARRVRLLGLIDTTGLNGADLAPLTLELIASKEPQILNALLNALRQQAFLRPKSKPLVASSLIAEKLVDWAPQVQRLALNLILEQETIGDAWRGPLSAFCKKVDDSELKNLCLALRSRFGTETEFMQMPEVEAVEWQTQVAVAQAYADGNQAEALGARILSHLPGLKEGSIALETPVFYGVIKPLALAINLPKSEELEKAALATYQAIQLQGLSVSGVTGGLGLGLSHVHCAAAALVDRNKERVSLTKKCGATDYSQALRHMWMVRAVMSWDEKGRHRWFKRRYSKIEPRAQILALALAEGHDQVLLSSLLRRALDSSIGAVAGSAAEIIGRQQIQGVEAELVSAYRRTIARREFSVVEAVIRALARLSYDTAEVLFSRHREDPHSGIRQAALLGLKAIETKRLRESGLNRLDTMQLAKRGFEPPPVAALERKQIDPSLITPPASTVFVARTTKGDFSLSLHPDWAFFASKKLVSLASQGFFNGQNITIKGSNDIVVGDPSGLGWEGKGRNVPDEVSPIEIGAGYLILDRSGRDTATSRLLITRRDRPDLYGRVNVVGKILSGTENLAAVVEGDRILMIKPAQVNREQ